MGICPSRNRAISYGIQEEDPSILIQKMRLLQQEINVILKQKEEDNEVYEREMMTFAFKEAAWRRERKKLREEVKKLRRIREKSHDKLEWQSEESTTTTTNTTTTSTLIMEQMREERARRDETVEKWKMLYLEIKNELDDLIQRTNQEAFHWRADEEDLIEELQQELKAKDGTIETLKAQIASMEDEEYKRKREVDILRQSLKIMSSKKRTTSSTPVVN